MAGVLRRWAIGLAAAAVLPGSAAAETPATIKPRRIMTMNLCADLLALQIVPKARLASVTYLAHGGAEVFFPGRDVGVAVNHGTAEDILKVKPDLILVDDFSTPVVRRLASRIGARVVEVPNAQDFEGVRRAVRQVGQAVGEPARAKALIGQMDAKLAWLAAHPPARRLRVLAWSGEAAVGAAASLPNAIITVAGAVNIAAEPQAAGTSFGVEEVLAADPDALLYGAVRAGIPPLASDQGGHRAIRVHYGDRRVAYNELAYTCGLPQSADAAIDLRRRLDALPPRAGRLK